MKKVLLLVVVMRLGAFCLFQLIHPGATSPTAPCYVVMRLGAFCLFQRALTFWESESVPNKVVS